MKFAYTILYVPDVIRAIEFYETAFGFQCRSKRKPWGQTVAYVCDLNGNLFERCTPIARTE
jgi:catechol 2,3-dioxygenase-like lactoylglutathione lyase family enzyme